MINTLKYYRKTDETRIVRVRRMYVMVFWVDVIALVINGAGLLASLHLHRDLSKQHILLTLPLICLFMALILIKHQIDMIDVYRFINEKKDE